MFDFKMNSRNQALNLKFLQNDLKKNDYLENPLLKMEADSQLKSKRYLILKIKIYVRLQNLRSRTGLPKFFTDPPKINHVKPP